MSSSKSVALSRVRVNVEAANSAIDSAITHWSKSDDDGLLVYHLQTVYQVYFNRRTTLLKELQILKAKDVVENVKLWEVDGFGSAEADY